MHSDYTRVKGELTMIPLYRLYNGRRYGLIFTAQELLDWLGGAYSA
jgi:hypothetical protein